MDKSGGIIIPSLCYQDARGAIDWLCEYFGFKPNLIVEGEDPDHIAHAQLILRNGMVMISSTRSHDDLGKIFRPPGSDGSVTHIAHVVWPDEELDSLYAEAQRGGAKITMPLEEQEYGGRNFVCRDPQGQIWSFGSYDPWAEEG